MHACIHAYMHVQCCCHISRRTRCLRPRCRSARTRTRSAVTGVVVWTSSCPVLATRWASETSGGSPTSVTEMAAVRLTRCISSTRNYNVLGSVKGSRHIFVAHYKLTFSHEEIHLYHTVMHALMSAAWVMGVVLAGRPEPATLADPGFEVKGGGGGLSGIHKSQRAQANSSDKLASSLAEGRWILVGGGGTPLTPPGSATELEF